MENSSVKPKISFCIPTYNRAEIVKTCVEHVLQYEGDDIEVVVSNNGSEDNTLELLTGIKDKRLHVRSNDTNLGFNKNLYEVLKMANGEFCFISSDEDLIAIDKIPELIKFLTETKCVSVLSSLGVHSLYDVDSNSKYEVVIKNTIEDPYFEGNLTESLKACIRKMYMTGIIIRKDAIEFDKFAEITDVYPHIYMLINALKFGDMTATETEFALKSTKAQVSLTRNHGKEINKSDYIHPVSMYYQMKTRFEWVNDITEDEAVRIALYRYICYRHVRFIQSFIEVYFPSDYETKIPREKIMEKVVYYNDLTDELLKDVESSDDCQEKFLKLTRDYIDEIIYDAEFI